MAVKQADATQSAVSRNQQTLIDWFKINLDRRKRSEANAFLDALYESCNDDEARYEITYRLLTSIETEKSDWHDVFLRLWTRIVEGWLTTKSEARADAYALLIATCPNRALDSILRGALDVPADSLNLPRLKAFVANAPAAANDDLVKTVAHGYIRKAPKLWIVDTFQNGSPQD